MNFNTVQLIKKTRDRFPLDEQEIKYLVDGFSSGSIPDYQISSWLMAVFLNGLSSQETFILTKLMAQSGQMLNWREISPEYKNCHIVDKHSTGGIGDKVSFILIGLCTAMGMKIPMMGGRGLGHTGGTIDKLESVEGFTTDLNFKQIRQLFDEVGGYIMGQTKDICPADKKLYSLRDVTGTVESLALITASIVSKKISEGLDAIVYDVKCGGAAFMENLSAARALAQSLVKVTQGCGVSARALITRMEEPLGAWVGNSMEIKESLDILQNSYESEQEKRLAQPLKDLCLNFAAHMAVLSSVHKDLTIALADAKAQLDNGLAAKKFKQMVIAQGGQEGFEHKLPIGKKTLTIKAPVKGFIHGFNSRGLGILGTELGMGRKTTGDKINFAVNFRIETTTGDLIHKEEPLVTLFYDGIINEGYFSQEIIKMFSIQDEPSAAIKGLIIEQID